MRIRNEYKNTIHNRKNLECALHEIIFILNLIVLIAEINQVIKISGTCTTLFFSQKYQIIRILRNIQIIPC